MSFICFINWPVGLLFFILFTITHPSSFQPSCSFLSITFSPSVHPSSHSIYSPNHLTYSTHITVSPEQASTLVHHPSMPVSPGLLCPEPGLLYPTSLGFHPHQGLSCPSSPGFITPPSCWTQTLCCLN